MVAFCEIGLHDEAEKFLLCLHLENRCVVVAEMIIGALPKVGARFGYHLDGVALNDATFFIVINYITFFICVCKVTIDSSKTMQKKHFFVVWFGNMASFL